MAESKKSDEREYGSVVMVLNRIIHAKVKRGNGEKGNYGEILGHGRRGRAEVRRRVDPQASK
jgi:hypothetical protein